MQTIEWPSFSDSVTNINWRRTAQCGPDLGNCVEVGWLPAARAAVRDSKSAPDRGHAPTMLVFSRASWLNFLETLTN
jgi:hypothetical protein